MASDNKLQHFLSAVYEDAGAAHAVIEEQISSRRTAFMSAAEDEVLGEVYSYIRGRTARIRTDAGRRVSEHMFELKRELFHVRTVIAEQVFDDVRRRIAEYVASDDYPKALENMALRAAHEIAGEELTIYLREDDMRYAPNVLRLSGAAVRIGNFKLGGLAAENPRRHLRLDLTYDSAMGGIAERFGELSDFSLNADDGGER